MLFDLDIPGKKWINFMQQWRPWSDAAFCGVWSGSALFAKYHFVGLQTKGSALFAKYHFVGLQTKMGLFCICR